MEEINRLTALLQKRVESHKKELSEINSYIEEQDQEQDKEIPKFAAKLLRTYLEEDTTLLDQLQNPGS